MAPLSSWDTFARAAVCLSARPYGCCPGDAHPASGVRDERMRSSPRSCLSPAARQTFTQHPFNVSAWLSGQHLGGTRREPDLWSPREPALESPHLGNSNSNLPGAQAKSNRSPSTAAWSSLPAADVSESCQHQTALLASLASATRQGRAAAPTLCCLPSHSRDSQVSAFSVQNSPVTSLSLRVTATHFWTSCHCHLVTDVCIFGPNSPITVPTSF